MCSIYGRLEIRVVVIIMISQCGREETMVPCPLIKLHVFLAVEMERTFSAEEFETFLLSDNDILPDVSSTQKPIMYCLHMWNHTH